VSAIFKKIRKFGFISFLFLNLLFIPSLAGDCDKTVDIGCKTTLYSRIFDEERFLQIHLPEFYQGSENVYPVIYVNMGELFFTQVSAVADFLSMNDRMPECIVVGIEVPNPGEDLAIPRWRNRDGTERINLYQKFLAEELIPYINENYRTAGYNILYGYSIGSAFALYTLLKVGDTFDAYIASSPNFYWRDSTLLKLADSTFRAGTPNDKKLFFCIGGRERADWIKSQEDFIGILSEFNPQRLVWDRTVYPDDEHMETPLLSIYDGLKFIFSGWKIFPEGNGIDLTLYKAHYDSLRLNYGYPVKIPENLLNTLGFTLLQQKQLDKALEVFTFCINNYPKSFNAYDSYGLALLIKGDTLSAIINYEKSLKLNPENVGAIEMLKKIR